MKRKKAKVLKWFEKEREKFDTKYGSLPYPEQLTDDEMKGTKND